MKISDRFECEFEEDKNPHMHTNGPWRGCVLMSDNVTKQAVALYSFDRTQHQTQEAAKDALCAIS